MMRSLGLFATAGLFFATGHHLIAAPASAPTAAPAISVRGTIRNGTTGAPAQVERLDLISLAGGMTPLSHQENVGPTFTFGNVEQPKGPLLLRATYRGQSYVTMVPPSPKFWNRAHLIEVYEVAELPADFVPRVALQVTKQKEGLHVQKILVIANNSRTTYKTDNLLIPVPPDATEITATLQHDSTRMPVTLQPERTANGVRLGRGLRPGNSAVSLGFNVPGHMLRDSFPLINNAPPSADNTVYLWWQPRDARPVVNGAPSEFTSTGQLGSALRTVYRPSGTVTYDFKAGGYALPEGPRIESNPVFEGPGQTFAGVLLFALVLLGTIAIASGLRSGKTSRKDSPA